MFRACMQCFALVGAVYKVSDPTGEYALKTEGANEQIQVLKMEVFVLGELAKRGGRHFCKIEDKGRYGTFNFVVMTLVGAFCNCERSIFWRRVYIFQAKVCKICAR